MNQKERDDLIEKAFEEGEPEDLAAAALARHIADHPLSTIQGAFRILGWRLAFDLLEERQDERGGVS